MHKIYLVVDKENEKAVHVYKKVGFMVEGELLDEFSLMVTIIMP